MRALEEVQVMANVNYLVAPQKLMGTLLYGAGRRLLECAQLRFKEVDISVN